MGIFILGPQILIKIIEPKTKEEKYTELLRDSKFTTENIFKSIIRYDSLTKNLEKQIDHELIQEKKIINDKREILFQLRKDFDSIYLTPNQLNLLSALTPNKSKVTFKEWISSPSQIYWILVSFFISLFFFYLGKRRGQKSKI